MFHVTNLTPPGVATLATGTRIAREEAAADKMNKGRRAPAAGFPYPDAPLAGLYKLNPVDP
jgi:hypothetical protein